MDDDRVELSPASEATRCPYCHDDLQSESKISTCELCGTVHHTVCFREGCVVYGCEGAPNVRPPLTAFRFVVWALATGWAASLGAVVGKMVLLDAAELGWPFPLVGMILCWLLAAGVATWGFLKLDRANARAKVAMAAQKRLHRKEGDRTHTEEGLAIITLGGIGGGAGVEATMAKLAENAPPPRAPTAVELPDTCPDCGVEIEEPEGKDEPDTFCFHCGAQLVQQRGREKA